jgi:hypothetical protein
MIEVSNSETAFSARVVRGYNEEFLPSLDAGGYETRFTPSATQRETFELRLTRNHITFGMPNRNIWWVDTGVSDLGWSQGVAAARSSVRDLRSFVIRSVVEPPDRALAGEDTVEHQPEAPHETRYGTRALGAYCRPARCAGRDGSSQASSQASKKRTPTPTRTATRTVTPTATPTPVGTAPSKRSCEDLRPAVAGSCCGAARLSSPQLEHGTELRVGSATRTRRTKLSTICSVWVTRPLEC